MQGDLDPDKILAGNKVEEVPLAIIQLSYTQLVLTLSPRVLALIEHIRKSGKVHPIHVEVNEMGYKLLDGHLRYAAYKLMGIDYIKVYYDPGENK